MIKTVKVNKKLIELFELESLLNKFGDVPNFKFQVVLAKNLKAITTELEPVREKGQNSNEFKALLKEEDKVKKGFAEKKENGEPDIFNEVQEGRMIQKYNILPENEEALSKAIEEFWEEHKEAKEAAEKKFADYKKYVEEEDVKIELAVFPVEESIEKYFAENLELLKHFAVIADEIIEL